MNKKQQRDAAATAEFLDQIGWSGEFRHLPDGVDERTVDRFWCKARVEDGHWVWTRATTTNGSAQFAIFPDRVVKAHRLAWELMRGPIDPDLLLIRQADCPHPGCINPDCYRLGTKAEASASGGRQAGNGRVKPRPKAITVNCSQRLVDTLRALHEQGAPLMQVHSLGLRAGLGPSAIQHILVGNAVGSR